MVPAREGSCPPPPPPPMFINVLQFFFTKVDQHAPVFCHSTIDVQSQPEIIPESQILKRTRNAGSSLAH